MYFYKNIFIRRVKILRKVILNSISHYIELIYSLICIKEMKSLESLYIFITDNDVKEKYY